MEAKIDKVVLVPPTTVTGAEESCHSAMASLDPGAKVGNAEMETTKGYTALGPGRTVCSATDSKPLPESTKTNVVTEPVVDPA